MPFIPNTPESFIQRSDSRDPAATCRGLTSTGRPCRRPVAGPPRSSKSPDNSFDESTGTYCWQHKDQAPPIITGHNALPQGLQKSTIRERTSIDTLVDRLGLLEVESPTKNAAKRRTHSADPAVHLQSQNTRTSEKPTHKPRQAKKSWEFLCCFGIADEEQSARPSHNNGMKRTSASLPKKHHVTAKKENAGISPNPADRPKIERDPPSRTAELLALLPTDVSPDTSAALLAELAKPPSGGDEPGFIYIFWLTPESLPSVPPPETTSSLLTPPRDPSRPQNGRNRRTSDVLQSFSTAPSNTSRSIGSGSSHSDEKKPILLKIGRANNVQRRMNEWQRQCGYNVSLIRFYPYIDVPVSPTSSPIPSPKTSPHRPPNQLSNPPASPYTSPKISSNRSPRPSISSTNTPRKVPNAHKVERLIHLELTGRGLRKEKGEKCAACGNRHREWFEIEGSRRGLRAVDEVIRRWVKWGEREGGGM